MTTNVSLLKFQSKRFAITLLSTIKTNGITQSVKAKKTTSIEVVFLYLDPRNYRMEKQEIYGVRAIIECIEAKQPIEKVWLLKGQGKSFV